MGDQDWNNLSDEQLYTLWQRKAEIFCQVAGNFDDKHEKSKDDVIVFLKRIGIGRDRLDSLSIIHITGTKGKGSTCAFVEKILQTCGYKTGLLSSPSLIEIRERIRVGGTFLPRRKFAEYGLSILQKLEDTQDTDGDETTYKHPNFIQYLTLLSMHIFLEEKVDVGIVEVFIGGETDCTNIFKSPSSVGITTLDLDHLDRLGGSLESIAWHKAGLARKGRPLFTVCQKPGPLGVIAERAAEFGAILKVCPPLVEFDFQGCPIELGPDGNHQFINASLAVQLARQWIEEHDPKRFNFKAAATQEETVGNTTSDNIPRASPFILPNEFIQALKQCFFPGRCQIVRTKHVTFYCDVAHTVKSMTSCQEWFLSKAGIEREEVGGRVTRVLMFSMKPKEKFSDILLPLSDIDFDAVLFSPSWTKFGDHDDTHPIRFKNKKYRRSPQQELDSCHKVRLTFDDIIQKSQAQQKIPVMKEFPSTSEALQYVVGGDDDLAEHLTSMAPRSGDHFDGGNHIQVLVTGCVPIVGGVIKIFDPSSVLEHDNGNM